MPKAKRVKPGIDLLDNYIVHLTKVKKQGKAHKKAYIDKIQAACDKFDNCFVFHYVNMLTAEYRNIQSDFVPGKLFLGKNKVAQVALGKREEDEYKQNLHLLSKVIFKYVQHLEGECGLLFTDKTPEEVLKYFSSSKSKAYARGGGVSNDTVLLKAGDKALDRFAGSMESQFRGLGKLLENYRTSY